MGNLIEALSPEKPVLAACCPLTPTIVIIDGYSETGKHQLTPRNEGDALTVD